MSVRRQATLCMIGQGDGVESFQRRLRRVLEHTPPREIELRLGFSGPAHCLHYALGVLCPDGTAPQRRQLYGEIERYHWTANERLTVWAWQAPANPGILRLLYHDVPLESEYVIHLDGETAAEPGWWEAVRPLLKAGADYIGQPQWRNYSPAQMEMIQAKSWYMGVPFERRAGQPGVSYMRQGFVAVRCERLREANYPESRTIGTARAEDGEFLLGEIARQLGWKRAEYPAEVKP